MESFAQMRCKCILSGKTKQNRKILGFSEKSVTYCSFYCCRPTMGQKGWSQLNQVVNAEALMGFLAMGMRMMMRVGRIRMKMGMK